MTVKEEKPDDWIYNAVPRSKVESVAKDAEARVTETVKNAVASYLGLYLSSEGLHRKLLNLTAGFSVQFDTRIRGPRDPDDPSVYDIQLARYWSELRQRLPCILIVDAGFKYVNPGLGGITDSFHVSTTTSSVQLTMLAEVPLTLNVAALDETTCGDIRDLLVHILGPLSHLTKGHVIRSTRPEDTWEVRMPLNFEPSGLTHKSITQDTKDQMWTTTISLTATFEGLIRVAFDNQLHPDLFSGVFGNVDKPGFAYNLGTGQLLPSTGTSTIDTTINVPPTIKLHQHAPIDVSWIPSNSYFTSTDPRIALINQSNCSIIPKKLGSFQVKLVQTTPGANSGPRILFSWDVKVVAS